MAELLDIAGLGAALGGAAARYGADIFRIENLPEYAVSSDGDDFRRWLEGAPEPDWQRKAVTIDVLSERAARGVTSRRIRVLSAQLSDYERYACNWGYAINGPAGEDIRVLRHGEHEIPPLLGFDYWLVDNHMVLRMHYDETGAFAGAEHTASLLERVRLEHDSAWPAAEPFPTWWERHPELHRRPPS